MNFEYSINFRIGNVGAFRNRNEHINKLARKKKGLVFVFVLLFGYFCTHIYCPGDCVRLI